MFIKRIINMSQGMYYMKTGLFAAFYFSITIVSIAQTSPENVLLQKSSLNEKELKVWWQKDYEQDTLPGISLDRAYDELLTNKKGKEIIVAVLDTKMDIHHEDLKANIWFNTDEIANNGVDDDNNGYADDIHGWDFLSNSEGAFLEYQHLEVTRIVKKYQGRFNNLSENDIPPKDTLTYQLFMKAKKLLEEEILDAKETLINADKWLATYPKALKNISQLFPKGDYTEKKLDSVSKIADKDSLTTFYASFIKQALKYEITPEWYEEYRIQIKEIEEKMCNINFNERQISGDDPADILDYSYGSPVVFGEASFQHATPVAGFIAANRENTVGIKGICSTVKIMPVVMVATGDEHDKDVALAIRYAVDNGAKVINMSWGKYFSLGEKWVKDAIRYAAEKDVLLVTGSGNDARNIDVSINYPNDWDGTKEIADNFLSVGASTHRIDKNLIASFSNYGIEQVDLFAPGNKVFATKANNAYDFTRGTSFSSPIVAGVGALIRSYYPDLTAVEVKKILMESGTSYNVNVEITQEDGTKKMVPFSSLSKSGKIVNAYNALLMAEQMSKAKE